MDNNNNGKGGVYKAVIYVLLALATIIGFMWMFQDRVDARVRAVEELHRQDMQKVNKQTESLARIEERLKYIQEKVDACRRCR